MPGLRRRPATPSRGPTNSMATRWCSYSRASTSLAGVTSRIESRASAPETRIGGIEAASAPRGGIRRRRCPRRRGRRRGRRSAACPRAPPAPDAAPLQWPDRCIGGRSPPAAARARAPAQSRCSPRSRGSIRRFGSDSHRLGVGAGRRYTVRPILRNEVYLGKLFWGRAFQERQPGTRRMVTRHRPTVHDGC